MEKYRTPCFWRVHKDAALLDLSRETLLLSFFTPAMIPSGLSLVLLSLAFSATLATAQNPTASPVAPTAVNSLNGPAGMPSGDRLPNINQTPTQPRFASVEKVWPEKPGDAAVCLWADDKSAVWSIEIDDNYNEDIPWWEEQSKKYGGLPLTWFVITRYVGKWVEHNGNWEVFRRLADEGFRVESHTTTHLIGLKPDWPGIDQDYGESSGDIDANIPNHATRFLAYPGGAGANLNDRTAAARHFAAARGSGGTPMAAAMVDYLNTNGFHPVVGNPKLQFCDPSNILTPVSSYYQKLRGGWANMFYHGVNHKPDADPADSASEVAIKGVLDFLAAHRDELWAGCYGDVAMYGEERDTARLTVTSVSATRIAFSLTSRMDPAVFNYPLTVKMRLPDGWKGVAATRNGKPVSVQSVEHGGASYALVKAVPGAGEVALAPLVTR